MNVDLHDSLKSLDRVYDDSSFYLFIFCKYCPKQATILFCNIENKDELISKDILHYDLLFN
jgi:hypothetical protein